MDLARVYQHRLLEVVWESLGGRFPEDRIRNAFFAVPRHLFVERYRTRANPEWHTVAADLEEHLSAIYANGGLGIFYKEGDPRVATISAPYMVLSMLELLKLAPGQRVFEVGTGSGWNAALMGYLVAPGGSVETVEIIPELVKGARRGLRRAGVTNVEVVLGDGSLGPCSDETPFDRAVFTAGASDIPSALFTRVREGGLLLFVLAIPGGGSVLILFERKGPGFESRASMRCEFVPVTGTGSAAVLAPAKLESLPAWPGLCSEILEQRPFHLSIPGPYPQSESSPDRSVDLRSYLWLVDPGFGCFVDSEGHEAFGIYDKTEGSLALVRHQVLTTYGGWEASNRLRHHLRSWVDSGLPGIADLEVTAYPSGSSWSADQNRWVLTRPATCFSFGPPR